LETFRRRRAYVWSDPGRLNRGRDANEYPSSNFYTDKHFESLPNCYVDIYTHAHGHLASNRYPDRNTNPNNDYALIQSAW
jgi:hypothetical protein